MIQANDLPLCEVLDSSLIAEAFQEDGVSFGNADEDVFTPAITCAASLEIGNLPMVSYFHLRRFHNDTKTTLFLGC